MAHKKSLLFLAIAILSIALGGLFGLLDIFGFIDGRHNLSLMLLFLAIVSLYGVVINVFLLNFANQRGIHSYLFIAALFFGLTFYFMNLNAVLSIFSSGVYYMFLNYAYTSTLSRSLNHIKFSPSAILFPVIKTGLFFLLVVLCSLAFTQSKILVTKNKLIHPSLVRIVAKPAIITLNTQLNNQIQTQLETVPKEVLKQQSVPNLVRLILEKTIENMAASNKGTIYGIKPDEIPINAVKVDSQGIIDVTPTIEAILPNIALRLNVFVQKYSVLAPIVVALLTFLILQPFMIIVQFIEIVLTLIVIRLLLATKFITIKKTMREVEEVVLDIEPISTPLQPTS